MRHLIVTILVLAGALGGYYLGHLEGSPDIFAWAQDAYASFSESSRNVVGSFSADQPTGPVGGPQTGPSAETQFRAAVDSIHTGAIPRPKWLPNPWGHPQQR